MTVESLARGYKPTMVPYAISEEKEKGKGVPYYSFRKPSRSYRLAGVAHPIPRPMVLPLGVVIVKPWGVLLSVDMTDALLLFLPAIGGGSVIGEFMPLVLKLSRSSDPIGDNVVPFVGDVVTLASSQILISLALEARPFFVVVPGIIRGLGVLLFLLLKLRICSRVNSLVSKFIRRCAMVDLPLLPGRVDGGFLLLDPNSGDTTAELTVPVEEMLFLPDLAGWLRGPLTAERRGLPNGELVNNLGEAGS